MSWLEDYRDREEKMRLVKGQPISADLEAWEKYVDDGMYSLGLGESWPYDLASADLDLSMSQEDVDIGEEVLDG
ncbi:hypothetical protein LCGC14_1399680 [marine sediment metagenome]|uniref:Uncharacterized protein n=1 Tax=marine sediment metagenome TaxID=412755 RepID=A0A0F9JXR1_9ZZZZ